MPDLFSAVIKKEFGEEIETRIRSVLMEFGLTPKPKVEDKIKPQAGWVSIAEAKTIVPIKSKKKWKQLRDEAQMDFAKVGKGFIYEINSLHNYIINHSTITNRKRK